jgi:DsbC/DsbD-like thiol-disulfide interchange protein
LIFSCHYSDCTKSMIDARCIKTKMGEWSPSFGLSRTLTVGVAVLLCAAWAHAEASAIPHGTLELIAEKQWIAPGEKQYVGLRFELEKGWHIYWLNPGDSGEPPRVEWHLPSGATAGAIEWPTPRRLEPSFSIVDYGYEDGVLLMAPLYAGAKLAAQKEAQLGADVKLLVCSHEMCIPGKAQLALTLPVKSKPPAPDARYADLFAATRKSWPRPASANWTVSVVDAHDSFVLAANLGYQITGRQVTQAVFFPLAESQIENAAPQKFAAVATGFRLTLRKSDQLQKPIARLKGVLVLSADSSNLHHSGLGQSYLIDVPVSLNMNP